MPLRKIESKTWDKPCNSSEHMPPSHMTLEPGTYEWTCPTCGAKMVFVVPEIRF